MNVIASCTQTRFRIISTKLLRATLDEGPRSNEIKAFLLDESHKLDPRPLDEGPRPKSGKLSLNLHGIILEGKLIGSNHKRKLMI
jgi:hypothetical protein